MLYVVMLYGIHHNHSQYSSHNIIQIINQSHFKNSLNVRDAWKLMNPGTSDFTFIDPSFRNNNSRIDILCVCEQLRPLIVTCDHRIIPCPDHKAVVLCVRCNTNPRGKGYWKLNISVLNEENYRDRVQKIIRDTISEYMHQVDKMLTWELVKIRVKEFSIHYCSMRNKQKENEVKHLESKINTLDQEIQTSCDAEEMIAERKLLKQQLDAIYLDKAIGAQIRSKVNFVEEGERSTEYFLAVEKHRQDHNCIKSLKTNGVTHTDDTEILKVACDFYTELYRSKNPNIEDINRFIENVNVPILTADEQNVCEGIISIEECREAVNKMKGKKSPGDDGLPIEFYRAFWNEIGSLLIDVYNECFKHKILPPSMRRSVITLIHKKDDKTNIENYRPISLTNTDYRILASILASRLQKVISNIVGPDQTAYVKNRFIGTNIRLIQDVFNLYNEKGLPGLFLFLDFKKAFDSIEWEFIFRILAKFNIGQEFQQWIKILYTNPSAFIKNNGHLSQEFLLTRGVRQGCQISSLLFILCMEILSNFIRQNDNITGLSLDNQRTKVVKIIQYADDTTLFLKNAHDMEEAVTALEQFGHVAGTQLNIRKCEGLWIGSRKHRQNTCNLFNFKWPTDPIKYLGIYLGHDYQQCYKLNFENKIRQMEEVLEQAAKRNLTLFGKVCIVKTLAISKIVYVSMCLTVPEKIIKEIDQRIFKFLWGKRDRIK